MIGTQIGAYRIVEQIGEGGMGAVFRAEHVMLGRAAAVKVLHREYGARPEIVARFFNEARAATQISDPGIVQIFDFGHHTDGSAYIVMELLDGEPLDRRVDNATPERRQRNPGDNANPEHWCRHATPEHGSPALPVDTQPRRSTRNPGAGTPRSGDARSRERHPLGPQQLLAKRPSPVPTRARVQIARDLRDDGRDPVRQRLSV